jgi:hypothetical protein
MMYVYVYVYVYNIMFEFVKDIINILCCDITGEVCECVSV